MKTNYVIALSLALATNLFAQTGEKPSSTLAWVTPTFPPDEDLRKPDRTLTKAESGPAAVIAYTPEGRFLATAGRDKVIRIWDARTGEQGNGKLAQTLKGHTGAILAIAFSGSSNTVVSVGKDNTVRTWDVSAGKMIRTYPLKLAGDKVVLRPGKEPIVAEATGLNVKMWNYETGKQVKMFLVDGTISTFAFSPDGKVLAVGVGNTICTFDFDKNELLRNTPVKGKIVSLALGSAIMAAGSSDGSLSLRASDKAEGRDIQAHSAAINAVAFSPRGEQVATASADKTVRVWDVETGRLLCTLTGHDSEVVSVAFNSNGQKMASGDRKGNVNYWTVPLPPIPRGDLEKIKGALPAKATAIPKKPRRVLVFWRADAILHKGGVPAANLAIELMGKQTGAYEADFTREYDALDPKVLANYDALVMNSTAHLVIPEKAKQAYLDFVRSGKGVVGIHAAMDTFRDWPEGAQVIGATFGNHPWGPSGTWAVKLEGPDHPLLRAFDGKNFKIKDEFYEMWDPFTRDDRRVLLSVDLSDPVTAGVSGLRRKDKDFALSWIKRAGEGRVFYCVFGHIGEPFQNPAVLQYYLDGIQYALGDLEADAHPLK